MSQRHWIAIGLAGALSLTAVVTGASATDYSVGSSTATVHNPPPPPPPPPPPRRPAAVAAVRG
jgi:hypothetical protein